MKESESTKQPCSPSQACVPHTHAYWDYSPSVYNKEKNLGPDTHEKH